MIKKFMGFISRIKQNNLVVSLAEIIFLTALMVIVFAYFLNADLSTAPEFIYSQF